MRMKDSGIEWIGEIPEDWEVRRLKYLLQPGNRGIKIGPFGSSLRLDDTDENGVFKVYGQENLIKNNFLAGKRFIDETKYRELEGYTVFPGDILISMMGTIGKCNVVPKGIQQGIMDSHLTRIRVDEECIFNEYLELLIADSDYIKVQFDLQSKGSIMNGLNSGIIKELLVAKPSMDIQHSIVNFINNRCAEIDAVIAAKQRQNELLKEQRQSIIFEAVTKGLDSTVTYKDSGVEWIGEIPAGWEVRKLKYFLEETKGAIKAGPFGSQLTSADMSYSDIKVFNQRTVLDNDFIMGNEYISLEKHEELKGFDVVAGDVLITTRGTIGKIAIVPQDVSQGIIHPCLMRVKINRRKVIDKLLLRIFNDTNMILEQLKVLSNATTIEVVYTQNLSSITLALPDLEKQQQILDFIEAKLGELDRVVAANNAVIDKLKEYRQSLIYETVTGKIAV